jgi:hypothetical protein
MTPRDRKKARRLFRLLCDEYQPKTQYQKKLLRDRANAEVLAERCQEVLYSLQETAIREASLHWNTNQTMAAQQLLSRLPKTPALICLQLSKTPQGLAILENLWNRLAKSLNKKKGWNGDQGELVFDLLGIPAEFRTAGQIGLAWNDPEKYLIAARQLVAQNLEALRDPQRVTAAQEWDSYCREMALQGTPVVISPEMRLMMRYELMHIRRADRAMAEFERVRDGGKEPKQEQQPAQTATPKSPSQSPPNPTPEERTAAFLKAMGLETTAEQKADNLRRSLVEAAQLQKAARSEVEAAPAAAPAAVAPVAPATAPAAVSASAAPVVPAAAPAAVSAAVAPAAPTAAPQPVSRLGGLASHKTSADSAKATHKAPLATAR